MDQICSSFPNNHSCLSSDGVRGVDYVCDSSCPAQGRLSFLLDAVLEVDDCGGLPTGALEILDKFLFQIRPGDDGVLWEVFEPCMSRPFQHHREVTGTNFFAGLQH